MTIKELLTDEQYNHEKNNYKIMVKNNEITFEEFCTNIYKLNQKTH